MDTIIYVYVAKNLNEGMAYVKKEFAMRDYRLVHAGISPDFLRILLEREADREKCTQQNSIRRLVFWRVRGRGWKQRQQARLESRMREAFRLEMADDPDRSYFVCEETISFLDGWRFCDYLEENWIRHMMKYAGPLHYVVLGRAHCLRQILLVYAKKMKSLRWILPERRYRESEEDLVEDLYEEYGIVVELMLLNTEKEYRRIRFEGKYPVTVLDFCEEEQVSVLKLPKGSVWLDMLSSETKRYRLEEQGKDILYFSLKKEWKQPQKAMYQLDTVSKNGYNT